MTAHSPSQSLSRGTSLRRVPWDKAIRQPIRLAWDERDVWDKRDKEHFMDAWRLPLTPGGLFRTNAEAKWKPVGTFTLTKAAPVQKLAIGASNEI